MALPPEAPRNPAMRVYFPLLFILAAAAAYSGYQLAGAIDMHKGGRGTLVRGPRTVQDIRAAEALKRPSETVGSAFASVQGVAGPAPRAGGGAAAAGARRHSTRGSSSHAPYSSHADRPRIARPASGPRPILGARLDANRQVDIGHPNPSPF
jgi:hypothetical protein